MSRGDPQGDGAVGGLENAITFLGQNLFRDGSYRGLVFNEENRLSDAVSFPE